MSQTTTEKHKLYAKDTLLSVTINPNISNQYFTSKQVISTKATPKGVVVNARTKTYTSRKNHFLKYWRKKFLELANENASQYYYFYMEISKSGLLHWHGTIQVQDPDELAHWIGTIKYCDKNNIEIDTIDGITEWTKYCSKDYGIHKTYVESLLVNELHQITTKINCKLL